MAFSYVSTEESTASMAIIDWKVDKLNNKWKPYTGTDSKFQLRYHPSNSFKVICRNEPESIGNHNNPSILQWSLILSSELDRNVAPDPVHSAKANNCSDHQPRSVMASINGGERFNLRKGTQNGFENFFFSDSFPINMNQLREKQELLTFTIWIEFHAVSRNKSNNLDLLADMYVRQSGCDVHFLFENDRQVGGHVAILSAMSPVFAAMFQPHTKEAQTRQVHVTDISFEIFKELLHYLYAGRLSGPLDGETAMQLFEAADKYLVTGLMEECVDLLASHIPVDNALDYIVWADFYSIAKVKNIALSFIGCHLGEIKKQNDWKRFDENHPELSLLVIKEMIRQLTVKANLI